MYTNIIIYYAYYSIQLDKFFCSNSGQLGLTLYPWLDLTYCIIVMALNFVSSWAYFIHLVLSFSNFYSSTSYVCCYHHPFPYKCFLCILLSFIYFKLTIGLSFTLINLSDYTLNIYSSEHPSSAHMFVYSVWVISELLWSNIFQHILTHNIDFT